MTIWMSSCISRGASLLMSYNLFLLARKLISNELWRTMESPRERSAPLRQRGREGALIFVLEDSIRDKEVVYEFKSGPTEESHSLAVENRTVVTVAGWVMWIKDFRSTRTGNGGLGLGQGRVMGSDQSSISVPDSTRTGTSIRSGIFLLIQNNFSAHY